MNCEDKVLLIDADSLIYYEAHRESIQEAIQGIDERVQRIFQETGANKYIMFLTEGKCFRYDIAFSKEYKGNRKDRSKPLWFNSLKGYLKDRYGAVSIKELEADDCVAYFGNTIDDSVICSPDKDVLQQCVGTHYNYQMVNVEGSNYASKGFISTSELEAEKFLFTQVLTGDSTDGIGGIEKVGPKTAEKWLNEWYNSEMYECSVITIEEKLLAKYIEKYGSIDGISRFNETFKLIYILKDSNDMLREIGTLPMLPEIHEFVEEDSANTAEW
jgi:hypothetical protein